MGDGAGDDVHAFGFFGDVGFQEYRIRAEGFEGGRGLGAVAAGDGDAGAGVTQADGHAEADAAVAAGDQGHSAGEVKKGHGRNPPGNIVH